MLDIKKLIAKMLNALKVDYIVAEGAISADTRYRKWNSGKAECWYHRTVTGITTAVWVTPIYYQDSTAFGNIWNGVFNTAPRSVIASSNYSQVISVIPNAYSANGITSLRFLTVGQKSNVSGAISIYAEGTWK